MTTRITTLLITSVMALVALSRPAVTQTPQMPQTPQSSEAPAVAAEDRARLLERWRSMDEATRERMRARFERYKAASPEQQRAMKERARRLAEEVEATERTLPGEQRQALAGLTRRDRERVLRNLVREDARSTAALLRRALTDEERARFESAGPEEREATTERLREVTGNEVMRRLGRAGRELGISKETIRAAKDLPPDLRRDFLIGELRERCEAHVEAVGLPPRMSPEAWRGMQEGTDEQFVRGLTRTMRRDPSFGIPPERWERLRDRRSAQARQLASLSEPSMELRASFPERSERELRRRVLVLRQAEITAAIARIGRLDEGARARLEAASEPEVWRVYKGTMDRLARGMSGEDAVAGPLRAIERGANPGRDSGRDPEGELGRDRRRGRQDSR